MELEHLKSICKNIDVKVITVDINEKETKASVVVEEEICDYKGIILFFYKEEFTKGLNNEIDLSKREERFKNYLNGLIVDRSIYIINQKQRYFLIKVNNKWKIYLENDQ